MKPTRLQQILQEYCEGLAVCLGSQLDEVILYGSQARGDAADDSDIDVLCVLRSPFDYGEMIRRTSGLTAALGLKYGVALSRAFVTRSDYASRNLPFLMNVRREGVSV